MRRPAASPMGLIGSHKLHSSIRGAELCKAKPGRLAYPSEPAYKRMAKGLFAFVSGCALLPHGSNAAYDAWRMAKCML